MKKITKLLLLAVVVGTASVFAADVKINDTAFPAKGNSFRRGWTFSTFKKTAAELNLVEKDYGQHNQYPAINGLNKDLVICVTAPSKITSFNVVSAWCNYRDRAFRRYVIEYSVDNQNWTDIGEVKKGGGLAEVKVDAVTPADNNGTVYLRFRRDFAKNDGVKKIDWAVLLKKVDITVKF